ncbi:mediator complex subunit MED14-domain-containing protein [Massariosphaeria phaeospora]|uniref:Mediator of RNA polymerase II transcription subunit 14 n=1 Tax=Massariosphaeria phaeospora TaxID=100035 RepID=A0A7C8IBB0_9PLEO|nr:mediator complex subunit MED14-domain-containing protein [Massariosphaeria phaeospora]
MNYSGVNGASGPRDEQGKKRSHDGTLVNGDRNKDTASNGPPTNGLSAAPAIAHIASVHYHPLSKLLSRIAQESFNDLSEVLQAMAGMPVSQYPNGAMPNGLGGHTTTNGDADTETNKQKKLLLMNYAQDSRAKFIKLLVLAEWGKKSGADVSKLIDVFGWMKQQDSHMEAMDARLMHMKELTNYARQGNPDIRTALEILSTGQATWMPDMGFIPPDPISSEKALTLLKYMNTSLSIRLNVHEDLPRHLKKWRVGSGRATFVIDNEFEFDVLSFVEDTSDQWHFIDIRFMFSPAPIVTIGSRFLQFLKSQLDHILRQSGLVGCFNHLLGFSLTHKINVLKSQAFDLLRAGWAGSLKIETPRRFLVVQYWTDKPGKKSWIEISVSSNRRGKGKTSWRGPPIPSLSVRWFRQGVLVRDADLTFDWKHLSMEGMLKRVIARHIAGSLGKIRERVPARMRARTVLSKTEPCDCALEACIGLSGIKTTLSLEHVTGRYFFKPATAISAGAEIAVNQSKEPSEISTIITRMLGRTLFDTVQRYTQQLGWQPVTKNAPRMDTVKKAVKMEVLHYALFCPRGWTPTWALGVMIDASGESWWIMELGAKSRTVEYAQRLTVEKREGQKLSIDRASLSSVERIAVHLVSFAVTTRVLEKDSNQYTLREEVAIPRQPYKGQNLRRGWVLRVRTADMLEPKPEEEPWLGAGIRVMCQGFKSNYRDIWHIASGSMIGTAAADMQKLMAAAPQNTFSFTADGKFSILLTTPFGSSLEGELRARLRDVDRLRTFATTLQKRKMLLKSSSLQHVEFQYSKALSATVNFSQEDKIKVSFDATNPHNRIHKILTEIINERSPSIPEMSHEKDHNGLDRFCTTLIFTRPILSCLSELESSTYSSIKNPAIHTHSIGTYRLTYENPLCSFDVCIKSKDDRVYWQIEDNDKRGLDERPESERVQNHRRLTSLKTSLQELFKSAGEGWFGSRSGILADLDGIPQALRDIHKAVTNCAMAGGYAPSIENGGRAPPPKGPDASNAPQSGPQAGPQFGSRQSQGNQNEKRQATNKGAKANKPAMNPKKEQDVIEID